MEKNGAFRMPQVVPSCKTVKIAAPQTTKNTAKCLTKNAISEANTSNPATRKFSNAASLEVKLFINSTSIALIFVGNPRLNL